MTHAEVTDWIDVPVTARHGMPHWPGNPPIVPQWVLDTRRGDDCNVSHLAMGGAQRHAHGRPGAPSSPGGRPRSVAADRDYGRARVIEIEHPREITADERSKHRLLPGGAALFRTPNSVRV